MLKKRLKNELTTDYWQFQFLSYSFYSILNKDTRYKLLLYMKREHNDWKIVLKRPILLHLKRFNKTLFGY